MTAFALHLPERSGLARWLFAAIVILALYAAVVAAVLFWPARRPGTPEIVPAIAVTLAPTQSSAPDLQNEDLPVGPEMQQAEAVPPEPPKPEEQKVEQQVQPPPPLPTEHAEVALPDAERNSVEKPKEEVRPPAPETRAPPKTAQIGTFSQAGSNAYNALVIGHLERFNRYPAAAHGAAGKVTVRFVLKRSGEVVERAVVVSSGHELLDHEALEVLRRASPFPAFPTAKPGDRDTYTMPMSFAPR